VRRSLVPRRNAEPVWRRLGGARPTAVPETAWSWITETGSLTRRVQDACAGQFELRLLRQEWGDALLSELDLLRADRHGRHLIREVELLCDGEPRVFARTVIPARSLIGRAHELSRLGTRPLGAVLFADPSTRRGAVEFARLSPAHGLFAVATAHSTGERPAELWGRRTLYRFADKPLLVNEIFLPVLMR
jgi:chorismate--pyruvate lyase